MTDKPMSPERLDKAIERLNEFVAGARGPYTNIVSDMKTVLAEIDAMRERAEKAEAAAQAEVMASGRARRRNGHEREFKILGFVVLGIAPRRIRVSWPLVDQRNCGR